MFKKLTRRFTAICLGCTSAVLLAVLGVAVWFSVNQMRQQAEKTFDDNVKGVVAYLQQQAVVDQTWMAQTERTQGLVLLVESQGIALAYNQQNPETQQLAERAKGWAAEEWGYQSDQKTANRLEAEILIFAYEEEVSYRGALCKIPRDRGYWEVTILKDRTPERRQQWTLVGLVVAAALLGIVVLAVFSYRFVRRTVEPVEQAHNKQTEFVSAASHELRGPLSVIRLSANTICADPTQGVDCAQKIDRECGRMSRLVNDLLLLAGSDNQSWNLRMETYSPKTILLSVYERFEPVAGQQEIRLEVLLGENIPAKLMCDPQRVEQALSALLENAVQYTPKGGRIRLSLGTARNQVVFRVEDSGPGIADEEKQAVFDRFYRAEKSRTDREHYGLGLSIVQEIVRQHKGHIGVEDSDLGGASFVLRFPVTNRNVP